MTNSEIMNKFVNDFDLMDIVKNIVRDVRIDKEDLLQEVLLILLEKKNPILQSLHNRKEIIYLFIYIVKAQIENKYSIYNRKYSRYKDRSDNNFNMDDIEMLKDKDHRLFQSIQKMESDNSNSYTELCEVEEILNNEKYWRGINGMYDRELFMMYYELGRYNRIDGVGRDMSVNKITYRNIQERTNINYQSVRLTVINTLDKIKRIIENPQNKIV